MLGAIALLALLLLTAALAWRIAFPPQTPTPQSSPQSQTFNPKNPTPLK